jgi:hypothetical protein
MTDVVQFKENYVLYSKITGSPLSDDVIKPYWNAAKGSPFGLGLGITIVYNRNRWVAGGLGGAGSKNIYYSDNGVDWNPVNGTPFGEGSNDISRGDARVNDIAYGKIGNKTGWVAVGRSDKTQNVYYSYNAEDWYESLGGDPFGVGGEGNSVAYNGTRWVIVGATSSILGSQYIYWSDDGIGWNPTAGIGAVFGITGIVEKITYGKVGNKSGWVAVGRGDPGFSNIHYSYNAIDWFEGLGDPFGPGEGVSVAYNGTRWVAVGIPDSTLNKNIYYSNNGITWNPVNGDPFGIPGIVSFRVNCIAYGGGKWVAGGLTLNNVPCLYSSTDGKNWIPGTSVDGGTPFVNSSNPAESLCLNIVYNENTWMAVGYGKGTKTIYSSSDGISWTPANGNPFGDTLGPIPEHVAAGVAYGGDKWVAVGRDVDSVNIFYLTP